MADPAPLLALIADQRRAITQARIDSYQASYALKTTIRKARNEGASIDQLIAAAQMSVDELTDCLDSSAP